MKGKTLEKVFEVPSSMGLPEWIDMLPALKKLSENKCDLVTEIDPTTYTTKIYIVTGYYPNGRIARPAQWHTNPNI